MDKQRLTQAVTRYQNGDSAAFNDIYELTNASLFIYAKSLMKDTSAAEDLLQNTYMEILSGISTLKDPGAFLTWSKRIMFFRSADHYRGSGREDVVATEDALRMFDMMEEEDTTYLPEENLNTLELGEIVWDLIGQLPEQQRTVMLAFYRDEMTLAEIAYMQNATVNTVKTRLFYGRKAFKDLVEKYEKKNDVRLHGIAAGPVISMALKGFTPAKFLLGQSHATSILANITKLTAAKGAAAAGSATTHAVQSQSAGSAAAHTASAPSTASGAARGGTTLRPGSTDQGAPTASGTAAPTASGAAAPAAAATTTAPAAAGLGMGKIAAVVLAGLVAVGGIGAVIHHFAGGTGNEPASAQTVSEQTASTDESTPDAQVADSSASAESQSTAPDPSGSAGAIPEGGVTESSSLSHYFALKIGSESNYEDTGSDSLSKKYFVTGYDADNDGAADIVLYSSPRSPLIVDGDKVWMTAVAMAEGKVVEQYVPFPWEEGLPWEQFAFLDFYWTRGKAGLFLPLYEYANEGNMDTKSCKYISYIAGPDGFSQETVLDSADIGNLMDGDADTEWLKECDKYLSKHGKPNMGDIDTPFVEIDSMEMFANVLQQFGIGVSAYNAGISTFDNAGEAIAALAFDDADAYQEGTHGSTGSDRGLAGFEFRKVDVDGDGYPEVISGKLMGGADIGPNPGPDFIPYYYMYIYSFKNGLAVRSTPLLVYGWDFGLTYDTKMKAFFTRSNNGALGKDGIYRTYIFTKNAMALIWTDTSYPLNNGRYDSSPSPSDSMYATQTSIMADTTSFDTLDVFTCSTEAELAAWING